MISELAITSKPIYIANMKAKRNNYRFQNFYSQFKEMKIIRDLDNIKMVLIYGLIISWMRHKELYQ